MKKLILVSGPPACGKTYVSKKLAEALSHVVYLDKDTLIALSRQIFVVANQPYNRSSDFFQKNIRDFEYKAIVDLALDALEYESIVLINAPFTKETRNPSYIEELEKQLAVKGARLAVVWIAADPAVCRRRMQERNSDRDTWKLANWEEYMKMVSFEIPSAIDDPDDELDLLLFHNSNEQEYESSLRHIVTLLEKDT